MWALRNRRRMKRAQSKRPAHVKPRRLGVWSWDEVVRVDLERSRVLGPGLADGLEGGSPLQPLEVLGEGVGRDKGQDVGLQALQVGVVEHLDGGIFDSAVHPLGLAAGPGM